MLSFIASLLFSKLGIISTGAVLIGAAVAVAILRFPPGERVRAILITGLLVAAAAHSYTGMIYQLGKDECEREVARRVAQVEARWRGLVEQSMVIMQTEIADAQHQQRLAEQELEQLQAAREEIPKEQRCFLETQEDVDAFNNRRR